MTLEQYKWDIENCNRCSLCKWVNPWQVTSGRFAKICPAVSRYYYDAYSAQGKLDIGMAVLIGELDPSAAEKLPEIVYSCNLCGACDIMCKRARDMEPLMVLKSLREKMWDLDRTPEPLKDVCKNIASYKNPTRAAQDDRADWAEGMDITDATAGDVEVLFFAGCSLANRPELKQQLRAMAGVLKSRGVSFGILGTAENCCGLPVAQAGAAKQFSDIARENIEAFNNTGAKVVITPCADCYGAIKVDYAKEAYEQGLTINFETLHLVEYLDRLLSDGRLESQGSLNMKVTYHDPCYLARLSDPFIPWKGTREAYGATVPQKILRRGENGCYDPPRRVIRSIPGVELVEMERCRENAWCCGAGGGVTVFAPDFARDTANERVEEALATGADAIVTACPGCQSSLSAAAGDRISVYDVAELLKMSEEQNK